MDDELIAGFEELADKKYPGSRHTRRGVVEAAESDTPPDDPLEGETPKTMMVNGKEVEFFTVGVLARALQREVVTIRKWERQGYLPKARFRSAGAKQNRLYTRPQILGIVQIAKEEGIYDPTKRKRVDKTNFAERVQALFLALEGAA